MNIEPPTCHDIRVIHVIAPYLGNLPLARRQALFLESVDRADREQVTLMALANESWSRKHWRVGTLSRDARILGDDNQKPFIKDLFSLASEIASPHDWILYTNTDCAIDPGLYQHLRSLAVTTVEYMRLDVEGNPESLDELFGNQRQNYPIGLDGLAMRASFWAEVCDHLPDFVIGEPFWDTTYSGILRRIIPVWRDKERLFHPKHDQAWDIGNPTPSGKHNNNLYFAAVAYGHSATYSIQDQADLTDTAVICTSFGDDPIRIKANMEGISGQLKQDLYADFYLVEMVPETGVSAYPQDFLSMLNHVPVIGSKQCDGLFQKESLMNIGWRAALERQNYDYFIFSDADIHSHRLDWFRKIRAHLMENPARAVQGFQMVRDTRDPQIHYSSMASAYVLDHQADLPLNPGLCWAFHRAVLEIGEGFNANCIECAGDSTLVAEYLNWDYFQYDPYLYQFDWFREIERDLPFRLELDCVPIDILHVHHGFLQERNYDGVRYAIDGMPPLARLVHRDQNGLLRWINIDCPERKLLQQRHRMSSRDKVDDLFSESGYVRYGRESRPKRSSNAAKPVFAFPNDIHHPNGRLPGKAGGHHHDASNVSVLNLFNPAEVFRRDFPFSWCNGSQTLEGSDRIPIHTDEDHFYLVLDAKDGAEHMVGVLPVQPSWEPFDLTGYSTLHLEARIPITTTSDVKLQLESQDKEGDMIETLGLSLIEKGLTAGTKQSFSIPLYEFEGMSGFDLSRSRLLKIVVEGPFRVELAKIFITREAELTQDGKQVVQTAVSSIRQPPCPPAA